ncbi:MAG: acyloxyacyl hydrolase [Gemmatimonadaceae bacterium]|nr:acyloxyacyl hydrolase [Gemmatimonadaceae bacterium]
MNVLMPCWPLRLLRVSAAAAVALVVGVAVAPRGALVAQGSLSGSTGQVTTADPPSAPAVPLLPPFKGGPLVTGYSVWAGSALSARTASHNERFDGAAFHIVGVQFSRTLFRRYGMQFSWLVEVLPAIVASVGAPPNRIPFISVVSSDFEERRLAAARRLAPYQLRDVFGVGFAPLGAEITRPITSRVSGLFNVTAGGAVFNDVVPYGKATHANFTVAPTVALELRLTDAYAISTGYTLHHLSNASFGIANPGLNSHLITLRVARARFAAHTNARSR